MPRVRTLWGSTPTPRPRTSPKARTCRTSHCKLRRVEDLERELQLDSVRPEGLLVPPKDVPITRLVALPSYARGIVFSNIHVNRCPVSGTCLNGTTPLGLVVSGVSHNVRRSGGAKSIYHEEWQVASLESVTSNEDSRRELYVWHLTLLNG